MTLSDEKLQLVYQHRLTKNMAQVFEAACLRGYACEDFVRAFVDCGLFDEYFEDHTLFSQSKYYILEVFQERTGMEASWDKDTTDLYVILDAEVMFWMGYLMAEWHLVREISGSNILKIVSPEDLFNGYDSMHDRSISSAINYILEGRLRKSSVDA